MEALDEPIIRHIDNTAATADPHHDTSQGDAQDPGIARQAKFGRGSSAGNMRTVRAVTGRAKNTRN